MKRVKLIAAIIVVAAATLFGIGSQALASQEPSGPAVASLCCYRP